VLSGIDTDSVTRLQNNLAEDISLSPYAMFKFSVRSEITRKYYERRIRQFFDFIKFNLENKTNIEQRCNAFASKGALDNKWVIAQVINFLQFQRERVEKEDITAATLGNFVKSLKLLCEACNIPIPWKKIRRGLPKGRQSSDDRAPTIEEIRKLIDYPDRRIKPIIFTMVSSGIRIGAWDFLQWKHVQPIIEKSGDITAARLLVYAGDAEQYYSFITSEAYNALKEWMDFRASYGEKITGDSWLMRDLWQTTNMNYGARWGLATNPKKLKCSGVKRLLERALWEQGIRQPLKEGAKRHEWKAAHGFRKFYKSRAEQIMKSINVEITMGHDIGISASYYKPTERDVLEDYLKAVTLLSISQDHQALQQQMQELEEKSKDNEHIIKGRLEEKDKQVLDLRAEVTDLQDTFNGLVKIMFRGGWPILKKDHYASEQEKLKTQQG
jgi:hypothetical protein